jgi:hypothetical protein
MDGTERIVPAPGALPSIRLFAFFVGYEVADKSMLTLFRGQGEQRKIPFQFFLVEHPAGRLLFDAGANPAALRRPEEYKPSRVFGSVVAEEDLAPNRLGEVGLKPEQVDLVANSHLHYDHAGGNCFFTHAHTTPEPGNPREVTRTGDLATLQSNIGVAIGCLNIRADGRKRDAMRSRLDLGGLIVGLIILAVGCYYVLTKTLGLSLPELEWDRVWPLFVIALGVGIVWSAWNRTTHGGEAPRA